MSESRATGLERARAGLPFSRTLPLSLLSDQPLSLANLDEIIDIIMVPSHPLHDHLRYLAQCFQGKDGTAFAKALVLWPQDRMWDDLVRVSHARSIPPKITLASRLSGPSSDHRPGSTLSLLLSLQKDKTPPPSSPEITPLFSHPSPAPPLVISFISTYLTYLSRISWLSDGNLLQSTGGDQSKGKEIAKQEWLLAEEMWDAGVKVFGMSSSQREGGEDGGWMGRTMVRLGETLLQLAFRVSWSSSQSL